MNTSLFVKKITEIFDPESTYHKKSENGSESRFFLRLEGKEENVAEGKFHL